MFPEREKPCSTAETDWQAPTSAASRGRISSSVRPPSPRAVPHALRDEKEHGRPDEREPHPAEFRHALDRESFFRGSVTAPVRATAMTSSETSFHACRALGRVGRDDPRERRADPRSEVDDDGEERPDVQEHVEEDSGLREAGKKALRKREMRRRGDGQELRQALHDAEQDGLTEGHRHRRIVTGEMTDFGLFAGRTEPRRERAEHVQ